MFSPKPKVCDNLYNSHASAPELTAWPKSRVLSSAVLLSYIAKPPMSELPTRFNSMLDWWCSDDSMVLLAN